MSRTMPKQKPHRSEQTVVTPMEFLNAVRKKLGIKDFLVDLAATPSNTAAFHFFCPENDGLHHDWDLSNTTCLHALQAGISSNAGVFLSKTGQIKWSNIVVSPLLQRVRKEQDGEAPLRVPRSGEDRKKPPQIVAQGPEVETSTRVHRQSHKKNTEKRHCLYVVGNSMAVMSSSVETSLRVLQQQQDPDPRSFHSTKRGGLPGHSSVEHGSSLQVLQLKKGSETSKSVVCSKNVCPYCSTTGKDGWYFLNPPYTDIRPWVEKASECNRQVVVLVPASVGSNWWRDYVHDVAWILFLNGRIKFEGHKTGYPKDLALIVYGLGCAGYTVWDWK